MRSRTLPTLAHSERLHNKMRFSHAVAAVQLIAAGLVAAVPTDSAPAVDIDPTVEPLDALAQLQDSVYGTLEQKEEVLSKRGLRPNSCNLFTAAVRRDW